MESLPEASDMNEPCGAGSNSSTHVLVEQEESKSLCLTSDMSIGIVPEQYQYVPLAPSEIRLLRILPGKKLDPLHCTLKAVNLATKGSLPGFEALSYAWGHDDIFDTVYLNNASTPSAKDSKYDFTGHHTHQETRCRFQIHRNLYNALRRIRLLEDPLWIWVDALCIDQVNDDEKKHQIPKMPEIYITAWRVIVWLGEADWGIQWPDKATNAALEHVPDFLNLEIFDSMLDQDGKHASILESWVVFGKILQLPWFTRRWVIQEIACARKLVLLISNSEVGWVEFADAVDLFFDKLHHIRELYSRSPQAQFEPHALLGVENSGAKALMELSRNIFRKDQESRIVTRLMDLESLVLSATRFKVTEVRDVIYALLYLANDIVAEKLQIGDDALSKSLPFLSHYSCHPIDIYADFVLYCIKKSRSLDVICRPWAIWPPVIPKDLLETRKLPSWIGVTPFTPQGLAFPPKHTLRTVSLVGSPRGAIYAASREVNMAWRRELDTLEVTGLILGDVQDISIPSLEGMILEDSLRILGWYGKPAYDPPLEKYIPDRLWRSLAANRTTEGRMVPGWYRRACALALTKLTHEGHLNLLALVADASQPSTMIEYLKRVQDVFKCRRSFRCPPRSLYHDGKHEDQSVESEYENRVGPIFGLGPTDTSPSDFVCILFGCSVPVILRPLYKDPESRTWNVELVGEAYVHDHMEGELLIGMTKERLDRVSTTFRIH